MSCPGKLGFRVEDGGVRLRSPAGLDDLCKSCVRLALMADKEGGKLRRPLHCGRETYCRKVRRPRAQSREIEGEEVAALGRNKRMQLSDDVPCAAGRTCSTHRDETASTRFVRAWSREYPGGVRR